MVWLAPPVFCILFPVPKTGRTRREHFSPRLCLKSVISLSQPWEDTSVSSTDYIWTGRPETTPPNLGMCLGCTSMSPWSTPLLHCCIAHSNWEIRTLGYAVEITHPSKQAELLLPKDSMNLFMAHEHGTFLHVKAFLQLEDLHRTSSSLPLYKMRWTLSFTIHGIKREL